MSFSLIWLRDVLMSAGLRVAVEPGWENRGRGDVGQVLGVICHHTAGSKNGIMPSLRVLKEGREDLRGPLAQLGLGRDGTYFVIAAGRCNHAGRGIWNGFSNGNANFIGIEAENTGLSNDFPWPSVQVDAYHRGVAAILKHTGRSPDFCAGHKEFALPRGRKNDPSLEMDVFRASVAAILNGSAPPPLLIPPIEHPERRIRGEGRPTLRRGNTGELVKEVQRKVGIVPDAAGTFGPRTEAAVRAFQREHDLVPDGIVGPRTWAALDASE